MVSSTSIHTALLSDLSNFDLSSPVTACRNARDAAAVSLFKSIVKKFQDEKSPDAEANAEALFHSMNQRCKTFNPDPVLCEKLREIAEADLIVMRQMLGSIGTTPITWLDLLGHSHLSLGAGSSLGSAGHNSIYEKLFLNTLTTTNPALYKEYAEYVSQFPSMALAENRRHELCGAPYEYVTSTKACHVPKTSSITRLIGTEPSLNMVFQRSVAVLLDKFLQRAVGYDPSKQPDRNRAMAKQGSIDGSIATIDLSSASDCVSLKLCSRVLPRELYLAVLDCRCHAIAFGEQQYPLYMVAGMGNGYTFSLETYIFTLILRAICGHQPFLEGKAGVFGDDIICETVYAAEVLDWLERLGFIPNKDKTFVDGPFRESCGTDWFHGCDIRGVYLKSLKTVQDRFSACNRLIRWSARHSIPLPETIELLLPTCWRAYCIPNTLGDDQGLKTPIPLYNKRRMDLIKISYFAVCKKEINVLNNGCPDNVMGYLLCASAGTLDQGVVTRRTTQTAYRRRSMWVQASWAHLPTLLRDGCTYTQWERAFAHLRVSADFS